MNSRDVDLALADLFGESCEGRSPVAGNDANSMMGGWALGAVPQTLLESRRGRVLMGLLLLLLARVVYIFVCPLNLIPDEAYYWDWSRQLDVSYYSKPPLIAWLIAAATAIGGDSEFAIRLPAALLGTLGLWIVYELGRCMYRHEVGVRALLIVAVTPGTLTLCLLMTIDAPFLLAWTMSLYCLWRMLEHETISTRWLTAAIFATGIGLLAKQSGLGLFPLLAMFLATGIADRRTLKSPYPWVWMLGSSAFLLPVIWWNHQHAWVTLEHTRNHFGIAPGSVLRHVLLQLEFLASQIGILSPVICCQLVFVTTGLLAGLPGLQRRERFLLCFGAVPFAGVVILSFFQRVQPNWPAALHLTSILLLAAWSCGEISLPRWNWIRPWVPTGILVGGAMSIVVTLVPFVVPATSLAGSRLDPTGRLRGWRDVGEQVAAKLQSIPQSQGLMVIAATSRGPVSELAYYLPGKPRVYRWNTGGIVDSQHDLWGGPKNGRGHDALIVTDAVAEVPDQLAGAFTSVEDLGEITVPLGPNKSRQFRVWRGRCLQAWPDPLDTTRVVVLRSSSLLPSPRFP